MIDIGYVILHYNVLEITMRCVESIKSNNKVNTYRIIIVDNCSPDGSGKKLDSFYADALDVEVVLSDKNLGFAKGNNIGYKILRNKCKYICILNSDVFLQNKDFFKIIDNEYCNSCFAVLGPRITLSNGKDNIINLSKVDNETEKKCLNNAKKRHLLASCGILMIKEGMKKIGIKRAAEKLGYKKSINKTQERYENIILHGCCLVFSPKYTQVFEDAFDSRTFLYHEEQFLKHRLDQKKLKSVYLPLVRVLHLEDQSTNSVIKGRNKILFYLNNEIASINILLEDLRNSETGEKDYE